MRLLVIGSRKIVEYDLSENIPEETDMIISGGAKGIDTIAEQYADSHGIQKLIFYPEYEKYGRAAPLRRNEKMVDISEVILAIWDGESKGTKYTLNYAKKKNKKIIEIVVDNEKWK